MCACVPVCLCACVCLAVLEVPREGAAVFWMETSRPCGLE